MLNKKALSAAFGVEKDADFKQTVLLLHGDGTNGAQNNTFTDSSTNNFTITRNGNTTQGTFSPFSQTGWSNYFDGSGDYLSVANNSAFEFGSGDFTIETWVNFDSLSANRGIVHLGTDIGSDYSYGVQWASNNLYFWYTTNGSNYTSASISWVPSVSTWYHIAITRNGNDLKFFINGTQTGSTQSLSGVTLYNTSAELRIGGEATNLPGTMTGYLSNFRLVKGTAVYTSNFTPPTAPLTAISGTGLLSCQSNRFIDNSTNAFTITVNGNTSVQAFSPFAPTAAYSAATNGGSGYFDGTGDYLSVPDNAAFDYGSGNFTLECWIYPTISNDAVLITAQTSGALYGPCNLYFSSGQLQLYSSSNNSSFDVASGAVIGTPQVNAWSHIAVSRDGNSIRCFLNGVLGSTTTSSATLMNATETFQIAAREGSQFYTGYISGFRVVKGTAVYTGAFTPPTAPLTAITNTSLLCNFTNAAIFDQTGKNNLETVGNAQIDTGTKKFGTGSLEFDGNGDYLKMAGPAENFAFGSGNFTIEMWFYVTAFTNQYTALYDSRPASTNGYYPNISYENNGKIYLYINNSEAIASSTGAITTGQWYHLAVTKSGTSTKMFLDGTQIGSTYTDNNTYLNPVNRPMIGGGGASVGSESVNGFIDDLRVTKGVARYTANFTPPAKAFADQ